MRAALPVLDDAARSPDPSVCPFFRYERGGELVTPLGMPDDGNRCAAIGAPRPQSLRQQELVCLTAAHADCPRYLRGAMTLRPGRPTRRPAVPKATVAALLILVLSAGISFGFVVRRGGIDLPVVGEEPSSSAVAVVEAPTVLVSADPAATVLVPTAPASSGAGASPKPSPSPTAPPTPAPTPTATPAPTPTATPRPTARPNPTPTPSSDRYKLLTACTDQPDCYVYKVRSGDNLYSIAHYFGISLKTIYDWNPKYANGAHLRVGDPIRMPPPTR
jgi:LysM repeat protein